MSLHSNKKDFVCPKCSIIFIPYNTIFQCPKCGQTGKTPDEYLDFIDICARSLRDNKQEFGSFIPQVWYSGCYSDRIQSDVFKLFAIVDEQKPTDIKPFIDKTIRDAGMDRHIQTQLKNIFFEVKIAYDKLPEIKVTSFSIFKNRLRKKLKTLLP